MIDLYAKEYVLDGTEVEPYVAMPQALFKGNNFIMTAAGNGMAGAGIQPGDYLVFRTGITAKSGDIVSARIDGQLCCRRIFMTEDGRVRVHREDGGITPDFVTDDCQVLGVLRYLIHHVGEDDEEG